MAELVKIRRGNVVLRVPKEQVDRYIRDGYSAYDENGNLLKRSVSNDIATLQAKQIESDKIIASLQNQIADLKNQLENSEGFFDWGESDEALKKQNEELLEQNTTLKQQVRELKKKLKDAEKKIQGE